MRSGCGAAREPDVDHHQTVRTRSMCVVAAQTRRCGAGRRAARPLPRRRPPGPATRLPEPCRERQDSPRTDGPERYAAFCRRADATQRGDEQPHRRPGPGAGARAPARRREPRSRPQLGARTTGQRAPKWSCALGAMTIWLNSKGVSEIVLIVYRLNTVDTGLLKTFGHVCHPQCF